MELQAGRKSDLPGRGGPPTLPAWGRALNAIDQDLRQRFRSGLRLSDGNACPSAEELWDAAAGGLPFERLQSAVDHAVRCVQCSEALRIARDVRAELPAEAPAAVPPLRHRRLPALVGLGLAAGLATFLILRPPASEVGTVERGSSGGSAASALRALSPDLQRPEAVVLRWSAYPGARTYNATVLTPELAVVHQAVGVAGEQLSLPAAAVRGVAGGGQLFWNVDAVLPDGRTVGSPTFRLRLQ